MTIKKKIFSLTFVVLIIIGIFLVLPFHQQQNSQILVDVTRESDNFNLKNADNGFPSLDYSSVYRNTTLVYRSFESIHFEVNTSDYINVDSVNLQVSFTNNTVNIYPMIQEGSTSNYTYIYTPEYYAPLGFQVVSFQIVNLSQIQINSQLTTTNFTITSNYLVSLNGHEFPRGDLLFAELIVNDFGTYEFDWNITIVDDISETIQSTIFDFGSNVEQISFEINDNFTISNKYYFIKLNLLDKLSPLSRIAYFPFKVLNTNPSIIISSISIPSQIKRNVEGTISLNVSDEDPDAFPENMTVRLYIKTSEGEALSTITFSNDVDWVFSTTFTIGIGNPMGRYQFTIEVQDQHGDKDENLNFIDVLNNPPEIHSYDINGLGNDQRISINYGEIITFAFNISDVENTIAFVTVSLLNENDNWYNITREYEPNLKISIRSVQLVTGIWHVYISVTDVDGDTTSVSSDFGLGPQEITIIPDLLTPALPWIGFAIGLIVGILASIGIVYMRMKSKYRALQDKIDKKERDEKKSKKSKPKPPKTESIDEEEAEEQESKEAVESKAEPQRKIRRKLK